MYTSRHAVFRHLIAKAIVSLYGEPGVSCKCVKRVHEMYGRALLGVEYDTFRSYVNAPDTESSVVRLPGFAWIVLQLLGYFRDCERLGIRLPRPGKLSTEEIEIFLLDTLQRRAAIRVRQHARICSENEGRPEEER